MMQTSLANKDDTGMQTNVNFYIFGVKISLNNLQNIAYFILKNLKTTYDNLSHSALERHINQIIFGKTFLCKC